MASFEALKFDLDTVRFSQEEVSNAFVVEIWN